MGFINFNGQTFKGSNITINGSQIIIDGVVQGEGLSGIVELKVKGDVNIVKSSASVSVKGDVLGDVDAGGSVNCGKVSGDVDAGGSVNCGSVGGSVDAGGSVSMRR